MLLIISLILCNVANTSQCIEVTRMPEDLVQAQGVKGIDDCQALIDDAVDEIKSQYRGMVFKRGYCTLTRPGAEPPRPTEKGA